MPKQVHDTTFMLGWDEHRKLTVLQNRYVGSGPVDVVGRGLKEATLDELVPAARQMHVHLPEEVDEKLKQAVGRYRVSQTTIIRRAIELQYDKQVEKDFKAVCKEFGLVESEQGVLLREYTAPKLTKVQEEALATFLKDVLPLKWRLVSRKE